MVKSVGAVFAAIALTLFPAVAGNFSFAVSPAPEWDRSFQNTNGWAGADVAFSIPITTNKSVWLFGDTWIGKVIGGKRLDCRMIHSSIAIQQHGQPPRFFYPVDKEGRPQSFMKSPRKGTDFWLMDGARNSHGLDFLMLQIEWTGNSVWGFRCVGTWLASVKNPDAAPARWNISTQKLPFQELPNGEIASFGSAVLKDNGFVYIYGYSNPKISGESKKLLLARVPEGRMAHFAAWEFFSDDTWTKDFQKITPVFSDAPPEGSVSWQPFLKKFVFVYTDGIWGKIVMRTADAPQGPWSPPTALYHCPDMKISPQVFCYAGKAHPEFSATNELLISYAANSQNPPEVLSDARLYWPRFIRVTFTHP